MTFHQESQILKNLKGHFVPSSESESVSCLVAADSLWSHRLWPTRRLCPWDFLGKNTGLGCHFLPQGGKRYRRTYLQNRTRDTNIENKTMGTKVGSRVWGGLGDCYIYTTRLLHPWDFPGKSTGMDCHFLLQGIFLTQGLSPGLLHCRQTLYCLSH